MNILLTTIFSLLVLFLPGFICSFIFFKKRSIDNIERIILSFILSIAVIPLLVFYSNIMGIRISAITVTMQIIIVILVASAILLFQELKKHK